MRDTVLFPVPGAPATITILPFSIYLSPQIEILYDIVIYVGAVSVIEQDTASAFLFSKQKINKRRCSVWTQKI